LTVLQRFAPNRYGITPVVVDAAGTAFLWQTSDVHGHHQQTQLWVNGHVTRLYGARKTHAISPDFWH
jgi:hypothetical protein